MANSDNQVIIFISGRRYLYKKHIYNVLAYPSGAVMDVTYSRKWVEDEIWNHTEDFKDKSALIIGICTVNGEDTFIPIRKVKLMNLETDGSLMHIKFTCEDWVKFVIITIDEEGNKKEVLKDSDYQELISSFDDIPIRNTDRGHHAGKFVQIQDTNQIHYSKNIEAWEYITNKIGKMDEYRRGIFFRFIEIRDSSNGKLKIKKLGDTLGYELTENNSYLAKISFNFGKEPPEFSETASFRIYGPELRTVPDNKLLEFRVYRSDFVISTPQSPNNVRTLLFMDVKQDAYVRDTVGNNTTIEGPFLEIPIELKKSNWRYASYILIFIGLLITVISSVIVQFIYPDPTKTDPIIEFFIRIIGVFIATFGITFLKK